MDNKKALIILIIALVVITAGTIGIVLNFNNTIKDEVPTYTVTFVTDNGTIISKQTVMKGMQVDMPSTPTKEDYVFVGWTYKGEIYDFSSAVTSSMTLEAKWQELKKDVVTFTVSFNSDGGTTIENQIVEEKSTATKPTNPQKQGYTFKCWMLNEKEYNFETLVEKDIQLKAKWEKNVAANTNSTKPNNNNITKPTQQEEPSKSEVKLATPKITSEGVGGDPESRSMLLKLDTVEGITGVEVYKSTSKDGTYTLLRTIKKEELENGMFSVTAMNGQHLYFKVRTYVKNTAGTFYSDYSNVMELDGRLKTPKITSEGVGGDPESRSMLLKLDTVEGITGVEVYKSTSKDGTYTLLRTIKKEELENGMFSVTAMNGQYLYFKVRTYVKNTAGTFYSDYSNAMELNNTN